MNNHDQTAADSHPLPPLTTEPAIVVQGTWDRVRYLLKAAKAFERGKLFAQVMTGFELLALRKAQGTSPGRRTDLAEATSPQAAERLNWADLVKNEAGISEDTAARYMGMARAAAPRLKELPALRHFDPFTQPLAQLPAPQQEAMETAVKKLTDGKTQPGFFDDLYKEAGRPAGREAGGDHPRKQLSLAKIAKLHQGHSRRSWLACWKQLAAYKDRFLVLTDAEVAAQIATLEQALKARQAWLKQPVDDRNPRAIAEMFNS